MKLSVTIRARIKGEKISNERKKRKGRGERKNRKTVGNVGGMEGWKEVRKTTVLPLQFSLATCRMI